MGWRLHDKGASADRRTAAGALSAAGLPSRLADAFDDPTEDHAVRVSHDVGMRLVGVDVGTLIISVDGISFFGPVVTPAPKGEAAGQLWDGVLLVAGTEGFFEIKRSRDRSPSFG